MLAGEHLIKLLRRGGHNTPVIKLDAAVGHVPSELSSAELKALIGQMILHLRKDARRGILRQPETLNELAGCKPLSIVPPCEGHSRYDLRLQRCIIRLTGCIAAGDC